MNRDTFEVQSEQEGERLDKYLSSIYPDISRSFFQRILKENQILMGFPHPSGANVNRLVQLEQNKEEMINFLKKRTVS